MENKKNYWCYRIDTRHISFFKEELEQGRLRQGWGYDQNQDLRHPERIDVGTKRNLPMFQRVKKGDILLVPQLPSWGEVAVVEATADWDTGYDFQISDQYGDYGHIFPAQLIKSFSRHSSNVSGNIRSTLKNPSRFWNINHYKEDVEKIITTDDEKLKQTQTYQDRFESSVVAVFNQTEFSNQLYQKLNEQFTREEWEYALVYGLKELFPFYEIDRIGGRSEAQHGTDILVKLPSLTSQYQYAIAIQVKDYSGGVGTQVIAQIDKANELNNENLKLIDKIVIVTKAEKELNAKLLENSQDIKFIFAEDLREILTEIGKKIIGKSNT
ncbi:hypothetical protein [Capnocytophaga canis]|uniref:Restriction endonuclease type IV Mrr domain-containing protein n=1 Tax=Capnocytophaga canis TaxID=1848903 RepID=A0A0B7IFP3_9FLAO|nr:hypothetical protein [Capnocytophaga canis]CEN48832.1 conserved hypothetical protein [Capnocytophaga canis]